MPKSRSAAVGMADAYLALGSNLGDPAENLRTAVDRIGRRLEIVEFSPAYWTEPVGMREQPDFLNAVLRARTALQPRELLSVLAAIEDEMGRRRDVPLGPRTIDLDLLVYDDLACSEAGLMLPHPRMLVRRFVLAPLADIAPDLRPVAGGPTVAELLAELPRAESVKRVTIAGWPPMP